MAWGSNEGVQAVQAISQRKPQLDGLRAIAVLAVLHHHFWVESVGGLGVRLFFVISGYLITGILLSQRDQARASGLKSSLFTFYARRAIRLFPPYYALIVACLILNLGDMRSTFPWHALYLSNVLIAINNAWPAATAHLWSLSVEEQFYLVWPLLVLTLPARFLKWLFLAAVVAAVAFRAVFFAYAGSTVAIWVATPAALDALGIGALMALHEGRGGQAPRWSVIFAGIVLAPVLTTLLLPGTAEAWYVWGEFLMALPMALLVLGASRGFPGWFGAILQSRPLMYIGKISYGIYLYHLAILILFENLSGKFDLNLPLTRGPLLFVVLSAVTILVASTSWYLLEQPINRLKERLPYRGKGGREAAASATLGSRSSASP